MQKVVTSLHSSPILSPRFLLCEEVSSDKVTCKHTHAHTQEMCVYRKVLDAKTCMRVEADRAECLSPSSPVTRIVSLVAAGLLELWRQHAGAAY